MDPSQDQESLSGLLWDSGLQHTQGALTPGPGDSVQKSTPLSLVHFLFLVPWIVCLHSHCLSSRVHLQTKRAPQFQRFRACSLNSDERSRLPKQSGLSEEMHSGPFKADRSPLQ